MTADKSVIPGISIKSTGLRCIGVQGGMEGVSRGSCPLPIRAKTCEHSGKFGKTHGNIRVKYHITIIFLEQITPKIKFNEPASYAYDLMT